jgi:hypothetical protein
MIAGWGKKALSWSTVALECFSDWLPVALPEYSKASSRSGTDGSFGSGGFFQAVEKLNGGADDR